MVIGGTDVVKQASQPWWHAGPAARNDVMLEAIVDHRDDKVILTGAHDDLVDVEGCWLESRRNMC